MTTTSTIGWGLIGAGRISARFARDLRLAGLHVAAIGARDKASAGAFAAEHGIATAHGSYQDLVTDPAVDVVYVGTPQALHAEQALLAIEAGKAVLVEKAFTVDAASAERVLAAGRERGVFVMEALWTRFLPSMRALHARIAAGDLGDVTEVRSTHHQPLDTSPTGRHGNKALGGGAMLDLGIYGVHLAVDLLGAPDRVRALGTLTPEGVDLRVSTLMGFPSGAVATAVTSMDVPGPVRASVHGSAGMIDLDPWWFTGTGWSRHDAGRPAALVERYEPERDDADRAGSTGMHHEALEVERCLRAGLTQSPIAPHADTVAALRVCDAALTQLQSHG